MWGGWGFVVCERGGGAGVVVVGAAAAEEEEEDGEEDEEDEGCAGGEDDDEDVARQAGFFGSVGGRVGVEVEAGGVLREGDEGFAGEGSREGGSEGECAGWVGDSEVGC